MSCLSYFQWNPPTSPRAQGRVGESQPPDELVVVDQAIAVQVGLVDHLVHLLGAWLAMGALRVETLQRELGKSWENHGKRFYKGDKHQPQIYVCRISAYLMCNQNSEKYVFLVRSTMVTSNKLKLHQLKYVNIKEKGI